MIKKLPEFRVARLNRNLSIEEFIFAFNKYKRIHCVCHAWRKTELDPYELIIINISRVYDSKFYEYHKQFTQKCAAALAIGKKINWAEKDNELLQMIIGGIQNNSCQMCNEVSHSTAFSPLNSQYYGRYYQSQYHKNKEKWHKAVGNKTVSLLLCAKYASQHLVGLNPAIHNRSQ